MKSISKTVFVAVLALLVFISAGVKSAHALTVTPIRFELKGDPGQVITQNITIINEGSSSQLFYPSFGNFEAQGDDGAPTFVEATDGLGTWMSVPQSSINLNPAQSTIIPVTIKIPSDALPGGYFGAVFFGTLPPSANGGSQVAIGAKTTVLVLLSVNGNVKQGGSLVSYSTENNQNFFNSLPVSFVYKFQNTGGDRVKPTGAISIKNIFGLGNISVNANTIGGNVLPSQIRKFSAVWAKKDTGGAQTAEPLNFLGTVSHEWNNFALGYYTATLNISYGTNGATSGQVSFWVIPWHLLLVILIGLLIIWIIFRMIFHGYSRVIVRHAMDLQKKMDENKFAQQQGNNGQNSSSN